jgi:serine/threonine protein kinase/Tol biopolymer transport system component
LSEDFPAYMGGFRPGSLLAGYRLEAQVGAGGMAVVFRAHDERLGRPVALKIMAPALAADSGYRRRFIAESRAAALVDDPHIIPIYEAGEAGAVLFIAMRFVQSGDLGHVLEREGALPPERAAGFVSQVASALDAAHGAGLVHRDVKPANILVDRHERRPDHAYLSDFGASKNAVSSSVSMAGTGYLGTPYYSAPEQIDGPAVDGRTDQYALACVTFQLLTGTVPFERDQPTAVLLAHLSAPPPSVVARRPDLPGGVDQVIAKGMAKIPELRFDSCGDFADALREALGLAPYHADSAGAPIQTPSPAPAPPETPLPSAVATQTAATPSAPVHPATEAAATPSAPVHPATEAAVTPSAPVHPATEVRVTPSAPGPSATQTAAPRSAPAPPAMADPVPADVVEGPGEILVTEADAEAGVLAPEAAAGTGEGGPDVAVAEPDSGRPEDLRADVGPGGTADEPGGPADVPDATVAAAEVVQEAPAAPEAMAEAPAVAEVEAKAPAAPEVEAKAPAAPEVIVEAPPAAEEPTAEVGADAPDGPDGSVSDQRGLAEPGSGGGGAPRARRRRGPVQPPAEPSEILPLSAAASQADVAPPASVPAATAGPVSADGVADVVERPGEVLVTGPDRASGEADAEAGVLAPEAAAGTGEGGPEVATAEADSGPAEDLRADAEPGGTADEPDEPGGPADVPDARVAVAEVVQEAPAAGEVEAEPPAEVEAEAPAAEVGADAPDGSGAGQSGLAEPGSGGGGYRARRRRGPVHPPAAPSEIPPLSAAASPAVGAPSAPVPATTAGSGPGGRVAEVAERPAAAVVTGPDRATGEVDAEAGVLAPEATVAAGGNISPRRALPRALADAPGATSGVPETPAVPGKTTGRVRGRRLAVVALVCAVAGAAVALAFVMRTPPKPLTPAKSPPVSAPRYSRVALDLPSDYAGNIVSSLAFSPSSGTLAIAGRVQNGGGLCLWDIATTRCTSGLVSAYSVAFSPDGKTLAAANDTSGDNPADGTIRLWNVATGKQAAEFTDPSSQGAYSVVFSPDGKTLATGDANGHVYLWNVATGKLAATFTDPSSQGAYSVVFSPDGKTLATGDANGHAYLRTVATGKLAATFTDPGSRGVSSVVFSPDGKTLAAGDANGHVYLWNVATRKPAATFTDPSSKGVNSVAFSPDGKTLASGDANGCTYVWNAVTGKLSHAALIDPNSGGVNSVMFSPNGKMLATADEHGDVYIW